jgi:hypothetical protein
MPYSLLTEQSGTDRDLWRPHLEEHGNVTYFGATPISVKDIPIGLRWMPADAALVRAITASFVHHVGCFSELCGFDDPPPLVLCRGAIYEPLKNTSQTEHCFRDFDLFAMQRNKDVFLKLWERKHALRSKTVLLSSRAILGVGYNIMQVGRYEACSVIPWKSPSRTA